MIIKLILSIYIAFSLTGCSSLQNYSFKDSFTQAVSDPMTWTNAAVGTLLIITDSDDSISESAMKHTYVFGSQVKAANASNQARTTTRVSMLFSSVMEASDYQGSNLFLLKRKGMRLLRDNISAGIVATSTGTIQQRTKSRRPTSSCCGWPSAHTSRAFSTAFFARENYKNSLLPDYLSDALTYTTYATAYATAWARVEAGAHYPSQVFFGAAYGNFLSSMIYDLTAFDDVTVTPKVAIDADSIYAGMSVNF
ncbi:hypothetical protein CS022_04605 [Veronia nyctiphanis]|uniref:Phosphatidic acid phosphatase type 2/haloperoxidase domain-containing protein n=1 Tax=Veronia nyctiphanis TaxID=1278244 RepID=A0A4Q0YT24_9GAMM|nr:phosphatase PAP2 family protein [Veronia nyctiphanis]RXJ74336.1 hypothetical protein CS022_04605 [Veronia nyctiphanis]